MKWLSSILYRVIRFFVWLVFPNIRVEGEENLPQEPCIIVGNHAQMNGPIMSELYIPRPRRTWCIGQMMHLKEVPAYAFADFWAEKPKAVRWFYKLLSYVIAPLSVCVFTNARTIGVYKDGRILSTFKHTVSALQDGASIVIFPEEKQPYNRILWKFQDKFVDVARLYYKKTGKRLQFVPVYMAPKLKKMYFGPPTAFDPAAPMEEERSRICGYLAETITDMACKLPRHRVVPYPNVPKKDYPTNLP